MNENNSMFGKIGTGIGANSSSASNILNFSKGYSYQNQDVSAYQEPMTLSQKKKREVMANGIYVGTKKTTAEEKEAYYDSLSEDDQALFEHRYDEGYGFNSIQALMKNKDKFKDPYAEGVAKYQKKGSTLGNIAQGVVDSLAGTTAFVDKYVANPLAAGIAKMIPGVDSEKVDALKEQNIQDIDSMKVVDLGLNADKDSASYNISNVGMDIAQLLVPGQQEVKGAEILTKLNKIPKIAELLKTTEGVASFAAKHPTLTKIVANIGKNGYEGMRDIFLLNAINGEGTSLGEAVEGGVTNAIMNPALKTAGKAISNIPGIKNIGQRIAEKGELMGNINSKELRQAITTLEQRGEFAGSKYSPQDVGKWMIERNIKGSKEDMYNQLIEHSDNGKKMLDEMLAQSTSINKSPDATKALKSISKDLEGVVGLEEEASKVSKLIKEGDDYTLSELEEVKRIIDDYENIYTNAGEVKSGFKARGMAKIRKSVKEQIEDVAKKEGLGDVRSLNNEIAMGRTLAYGIGNKSASEILNQWTSGALGSLGTAIAGGDLAQITFMGAVTSILGSTTFRTHISNALGKASGIETKTLDEIKHFVRSKGKTELSKEGQNAFKKFLKEHPDLFTDADRIANTEIIRWLNSGDDVDIE